MVVRGPYINPAYLARLKKISSVQLETQRPSVENIENAEQFREKITSGRLTVCFFTDSMFNPCRYYENVFKSVASDFKDNARFIRFVAAQRVDLENLAPFLTCLQESTLIKSSCGRSRYRKKFERFRRYHFTKVGLR